jgi:hypothetical protein
VAITTSTSINYDSDQNLGSAGFSWADATKPNSFIGQSASMGALNDEDGTKELWLVSYDDIPPVPAKHELLGLNWQFDIVNGEGPRIFRMNSWLTFDHGASRASDVLVTFFDYNDGNDPKLIYTGPHGFLWGINASIVAAEMNSNDFGMVVQLIQTNGESVAGFNFYTPTMYAYTQPQSTEATFRNREGYRGRALGLVR